MHSVFAIKISPTFTSQCITLTKEAGEIWGGTLVGVFDMDFAESVQMAPLKENNKYY